MKLWGCNYANCTVVCGGGEGWRGWQRSWFTAEVKRMGGDVAVCWRQSFLQRWKHLEVETQINTFCSSFTEFTGWIFSFFLATNQQQWNYASVRCDYCCPSSVKCLFSESLQPSLNSSNIKTFIQSWRLSPRAPLGRGSPIMSFSPPLKNLKCIGVTVCLNDRSVSDRLSRVQWWCLVHVFILSVQLQLHLNVTPWVPVWNGCVLTNSS